MQKRGGANKSRTRATRATGGRGGAAANAPMPGRMGPPTSATAMMPVSSAKQPSPNGGPAHTQAAGKAAGALGTPRASGEAGANGPLVLNILEHPSSPHQQPNMLADPALDTPHSVSEILDGPGEFNDLMRFLGTEPEDQDVIDFLP